jgi:hypothetical protein
MTPCGARSLWTVFTATVVVGLVVSLVGCATVAPLTPVAVSDVKSVAGTWKGTVYQSSQEPDNITLTIREDGSYEIASRYTAGASRGQGQIAISEGRLILKGVKGAGVATVLSNPGGYRVMNIEATLSDNSTLTAKLWPSP